MLSSTKSRNAGKTLLQTLFFFLLVTQICFSQWVQLGLDDKGIKETAAYNSIIFAVTSDSGSVYRSTDNGINWLQIVDSGAVDIAIGQSGTVFMVKDFPDLITAVLLFSSSNNGDIWDTLNVWGQLPPWNCAVLSMNVSVSPVGIVYCGLFLSCFEHAWPNHIALSTDDGLTWAGVEIFAGALTDFRNQSVISAGTNGLWLAGELNEFNVKNLISAGYEWWCDWMYLSSDNGVSWSFVGSPPTLDCRVLGLCLNGNILLGGGGGLYLSSDSCSTWTQVSAVFPQAGLSIESGGMLIGNDSLGVFLFSDNGDSLGSFNEGLSNLNIHTLSMDNNGYVYLGTDNGVWQRPLSEIVPVELTSFTAIANGKEVILNWSTATELNNRGFEIQRSTEGEEFFTVGFVSGHGTITEQQNYSYSDNRLDNGKYYYRLKQIDYEGSFKYSDVVEVEWRAFASYLLEQNYPNPFNPTTTISFGIQNKSNVKITILNAIGEEVAVILNEEREAGYHRVEFSAKGGSASGGNAYNLPSGVYFYQLKADNFIETKKMLLLK